MLSLAALALIVWAYWRRLEGETIAIIISVWTIVALMRLHVVDTVLSDLPFAAALWLTFLVADSPKNRTGARHFAALAVAGALTFAFRMAGLPLLPAMACYFLVRPASERRGLFIAGTVWALSAAYVLFFLPGADALGSEVARTPQAVIRDVLLNLQSILGGVRNWVPLTIPWKPANIALHSLFLAVGAWGSLLAFREHKFRFAYLTAAWYIVMLIVLPVGATRYVWPLYPLITFGFIRGVQALVPVAALGARRATLGLAAVCVLFVAGLIQDFTAQPPRALVNDAEAQEIVETLRAEARGRPIRAAFFSPRVLTWETGITATAFGSGPTEALYDEVRRGELTHVVVGDAGTSSLGRDSIASMVQRYKSAFVPIKANRTFVLYEVRADSVR
jgi:hypothetical protein